MKSNMPLPDGAAKGRTVPLKPMLADYYAARGWDRDSGYPGKETYNRLKLTV